MSPKPTTQLRNGIKIILYYIFKLGKMDRIVKKKHHSTESYLY